jgi:hypothetical protein
MGGAGVTLLPALAVAVENRSGELVLRRFEEPSPGRTIALVRRRRSPQAAALQELAKVLREEWLRAHTPARYRVTRSKSPVPRRIVTHDVTMAVGTLHG